MHKADSACLRFTRACERAPLHGRTRSAVHACRWLHGMRMAARVRTSEWTYATRTLEPHMRSLQTFQACAELRIYACECAHAALVSRRQRTQSCMRKLTRTHLSRTVEHVHVRGWGARASRSSRLLRSTFAYACHALGGAGRFPNALVLA
eukprot:3381077-Pleurochrysis_carterae.AAC.1